MVSLAQLLQRPRPLSAGPLNGRIRYCEITADLSCKVLVDLSVSRNRGDLARRTIHIDRVLATLPQEFAAVSLEVADEIAPLHPVILSRSRITFAAPT